MGSRFVLEGLDQLRQGTQAFARNRENSRMAQERQDERDAQETAARLRKERTDSLHSDADALFEEASNDPDFSREDLARGSLPFSKASIDLQDPNIMSALKPIEGILKDRESAKDREATIEASGVKDTHKAEARKQKSRRELRKNFRQDDTTKATRKSRKAFQTIKAASERKSPAGDVALITQFSKSIDEGARVTDQDFKNAQSARAALTRIEENAAKDGFTIPTFLKQTLQRWDPEDGTTLTQGQRDDFFRTAEAAHVEQLKLQGSIDDDFAEEAKLSGLDPKNIVRDRASNELTALEKVRSSRKPSPREKARARVAAASEEKGIRGSVREVDEVVFDQFLDSNRQVFDAKVEQVNAARAADDKPPLTEAEIQKVVRELAIRKAGIRLKTD